MAKTWTGRFPRNDIISLLDIYRPLNLAESTSQDLHFGELIDLIGYEKVRDVRLGYGSAQGLELLRDAIASLCHIAADQVVTTQGTALAIYLLAIELCRSGDEVVLFTPCFPPSRDALLGSDITVREVPLKFEDSYRVDIKRLAQKLTAKTRLISLATPQNPSGVSTMPETISAILRAMDRSAPNAYLFIDETYRCATYGDAMPLASFAGYDRRIITGGSVSKAYGAPGLRIGWVTTEDAHLRERLMTAKMNVVISGSPLDETLAAHLIKNCEAVLAPRRALLATGLNILEAWHISEAHRLDWVRPDSGALCCMRLSEKTFDDAAITRFWNTLPDLDLQLAAGSWFGESDRIFRLGFGYLTIARLSEALATLSKAMDLIQG